MRAKKKSIVYAVINRDSVLYASKDEDNAQEMCERYQEDAINDAKDDLDIDEDDDDLNNDDDPMEGFNAVRYQAGVDCGTFYVVEIDLNKYSPGTTISVPQHRGIYDFGLDDNVEYDEIIDKLNENGEDEYEENDEDDAEENN